MKIIAINGSSRKNWNTHILLNNAIEGAQKAGAETELIHLCDLNFKGCRSCFGCKSKANPRPGHCVYGDELKPVLDKIDEADGLILASPIYLSEVSSAMRAFLERLIFQYSNFDGQDTYFTGTLKTAFLYTMNAPSHFYEEFFKKYEKMLGWDFDYIGTVASGETQQHADYSQYYFSTFDETERKERRKNIFPLDCQKAFDLGEKMARAIAGEPTKQ
ncbi:MAG: flavodoxin family protein [Eubacteriales bacterium]|nr:flavodoxin family protein [Eubacteriales bacterium]